MKGETADDLVVGELADQMHVVLGVAHHVCCCARAPVRAWQGLHRARGRASVHFMTGGLVLIIDVLLLVLSDSCCPEPRHLRGAVVGSSAVSLGML